MVLHSPPLRSKAGIPETPSKGTVPQIRPKDSLDGGGFGKGGKKWFTKVGANLGRWVFCGILVG